MEIRTSDVETFIRAAYLLASLDRNRFSAEQLEVVDAAADAVGRAKERIEYDRNRKSAYMKKRRKDDTYYGQQSRNPKNKKTEGPA